MTRRGDFLYSAGRDATARCWSTGASRIRCERTFDEHTDWVNDLVLLADESRLVTASSDTTLKIWNTGNQRVVHTLHEHQDYVKALAYARQTGQLASAGLDRDVLLWDLETGQKTVAGPGGQRITVQNQISLTPCSGHRDSVYCLATNPSGSLFVSGSTERVSTHAIGLLRIWDPRALDKKVGRLKGHTDNVRCVIVSDDGTKCISGSSDATIKLWDIGQQRCIQTIAAHTDSVWSMAADGGLTRVLSGGRDKLVFCTDMKAFESTLLLRAREPVLKLVLAPDELLWVSSTHSDLECWDCRAPLLKERDRSRGPRAPSLHTISAVQRRNIPFGASASSNLAAVAAADQPEAGPLPLVEQPCVVVQGLPAIVKHDFLENRRHVLTLDTAGMVSAWDVTSGKRVKDFGKVDFDQHRKALEEELVVPAWCSVDCRLGSLTVNLDFPQVFAAELYAVDAGHERLPDLEDQKVNVGFRIVRMLFKYWIAYHCQRRGGGGNGMSRDGDEEDVPPMPEEVDETLDYKLPEDTRVVVTEGAMAAPLLCKRVAEVDGTEDPQLLPEWLLHTLERGYTANDRGEPLSEAPKIGFHLMRSPTCGDMRQMQAGKLNAPQILRARKVLAYAVSKLALEIPPHMRRAGTDDVVEYLELLCNERVVPPEMNLMTIRRFYAKGADELTLHYRWKQVQPQPLPQQQQQQPPQQQAMAPPVAPRRVSNRQSPGSSPHSQASTQYRGTH
eukprot:CAMPEP_0196734602 /NCGR_PEP_ID=MMETSP1091-20130531/13282_1 /TAXON_ID=302021 /ORGANISM="Rhodomonas sp., Strain CCMP768" /LENGTH=729 /DNA_ID=CAMNT_0042078125 /DNA_START=337 /DNA_END=2526 /DNA_ORIENTATION=+